MTKANHPSIAVVGATGQVGSVMLKLLAERRIDTSNLRAFASSRSAGTKVACGDRMIVVEDAATADCAGIDFALFSAGATTSRAVAPLIAAVGAIVIDNSSAWRRDPDVPLVVSESARIEFDSEGDRRESELHHDGCDACDQTSSR